MNENLISWNVPNWITVFLMAATGFALLTAVTAAGKKMVASRVSDQAG